MDQTTEQSNEIHKDTDNSAKDTKGAKKTNSMKDTGKAMKDTNVMKDIGKAAGDTDGIMDTGKAAKDTDGIKDTDKASTNTDKDKAPSTPLDSKNDKEVGAHKDTNAVVPPADGAPSLKNKGAGAHELCKFDSAKEKNANSGGPAKKRKLSNEIVTIKPPKTYAKQRKEQNSDTFLITTHLERAVRISNLPYGVSIQEILNHVRTGVLEFAYVDSRTTTALISFMDSAGARLFYQQCVANLVELGGQKIKLTVFLETTAPPEPTLQVAMQKGASRTVFIGKLPDEANENTLRSELSRFGDIEFIKIVSTKYTGRPIAFVYYTTVKSAITCVTTLAKETQWTGRKVFYGQDRCALPSNDISRHNHMRQELQEADQIKKQQTEQQQESILQLMKLDPLLPLPANDGIDMAKAILILKKPTPPFSTFHPDSSSRLQRTLYFENLPNAVTYSQLFCAIRGAQIYKLSLVRQRNIAFVIFVDPAKAALFHALGNTAGVDVTSRRIRVRWGKPASISAATLLAIQQGATRMICIHINKDNGDTNMAGWDTKTLNQECGKYGDIERTYMVPDCRRFFCNYTSVTAAMEAIMDLSLKPKYQGMTIGYAIDRFAQEEMVSEHQQQQISRIEKNLKIREEAEMVKIKGVGDC